MRATVPQEARPWQLGEKQPVVEGPQALFVGGYLASGANCISLTSGPLAVQAVALLLQSFGLMSPIPHRSVKTYAS